MAITYTQLVASLQTYLETDETSFVAAIPRFVSLAEDRILRDVQLPRYRKHSTTTMTSGARYLATPTDYLSPYSLAIIDTGTGAYTWLVNKDPEFIREAYPDPTSTGEPKFYATYDNDTLLVGPNLDANYTMELAFYHRPESITTAETSWLGDFAESVLLNASLVEADLYQKGETFQEGGQAVSKYEERYQTGIMRLKNQAEGMARTDAYREPQTSMEVT